MERSTPLRAARRHARGQTPSNAYRDNNPFGENDWDALANEWDSKELDDWGFDVWQEPQKGEESPTNQKMHGTEMEAEKPDFFCRHVGRPYL